MTDSYLPLEGNLVNSIVGENLSFSTKEVASLFDSFNTIWKLEYTALLGAVIIMIIIGGVVRQGGGVSSIRKSNEIWRHAVLGLLAGIGIYLIAATFNPNLLRGDVDLSAFESKGVGSGTGQIAQDGSSSSGVPKACASLESVKTAVASGNVCAGSVCTALSGCNYQPYLSMIKQEAERIGVDYKIVIVTMCKESKASPNAQGVNRGDGVRTTYDCGLMQTNQLIPCNAQTLDPLTNIKEGITKLKIAIAGQRIYPGVPTLAGAFASYNCCANGTPPNAPSADCNAQSGFDTAIPKWACPINPGTSASNMCAVKAYSCELVACLGNL